ncbi:hypothetical protein MN608_01888 [Microdochium nivale]|nr:hypothetical protein MN608_01888 [Microdochium nivale]
MYLQEAFSKLFSPPRWMMSRSSGQRGASLPASAFITACVGPITTNPDEHVQEGVIQPQTTYIPPADRAALKRPRIALGHRSAIIPTFSCCPFLFCSVDVRERRRNLADHSAQTPQLSGP